MVRDVTPKIYGFPGLPKWLDFPFIKRTAERYGITTKKAREHLRLNTLRELPTAQGEIRGKTDTDESGTDSCIQVDRTELSKEPKDAPEVSPEDGW